jgi:O-antigen/teichoic acid export membrane protein
VTDSASRNAPGGPHRLPGTPDVQATDHADTVDSGDVADQSHPVEAQAPPGDRSGTPETLSDPIGPNGRGDEPADGHGQGDGAGDEVADDQDRSLELMLEEIDLAVEPVGETASMAPAMGIPVAGGPMITLPEDEDRGTHVERHHKESLLGGILQAGPVAVAGLLVNGLGVVVVVVVARLVSPRAYGTIAVLLGLFFILSMPGSAVLVGVVRRVTIWQKLGEEYRVHPWALRVYRRVAAAVVVEAVIVWLAKGFIASELNLPNTAGVFAILVAAGIWILLSVDRGLLQAHRDYRGLAGNLLVEGLVRSAFVVGLVAAGFGVGGYAIGIFIGEVMAAAHARWLASRAWPAMAPAGPAPSAAETAPTARRSTAPSPTAPGPTAPSPAVAGITAPVSGSHRARGRGRGLIPSAPDPVDGRPAVAAVARRALLYDVSAAFVGLALLALLQNVDVLILGRQAGNSNVIGSYAAISVASKALVFGALALGSYLLPEATIRWNDGGHALRQLGVTLLFLAVPAVVLLGVSIFIPKQFITLFFGAKLSTAASAFAPLVAAMIFLAISVLLTNYLFGAGRRWIVIVLAVGAALSVVLVAGAHGNPVDTAKADLIVQAALACGIGCFFVAIHRRAHRSR